MTAAFFVAAVLINVVLRDNKQTYAVLEESAMGSTTVVVEFVVTVAFGSSVCSNCICYLLEVHKGKKRQHLMSIFVAFIACLSGLLNITGWSPTYYNEAAGWTYVSHTLRCIPWRYMGDICRVFRSADHTAGLGRVGRAASSPSA